MELAVSCVSVPTTLGSAIVSHTVPITTGGDLTESETVDFSTFVPAELHDLKDVQTAIPRIAKDVRLLADDSDDPW